MKQPVMAFWPYSSAFCNKHFGSGIVTNIDKQGNVETKNYGKGFYFKPVAFFPLKEGKKLQAELNALEAWHDAEDRTMRTRHFEEVADMIGDRLPFKKEKS